MKTTCGALGLMAGSFHRETAHSTRTLSDSDVFIDDMGLIVVSTGDVALRDVEANENGVLGANILADGKSQSQIVNSIAIRRH